MTVTKITDNVIAKIIKLPIFIQIYIIFLKKIFSNPTVFKNRPGRGQNRGATRKIWQPYRNDNRNRITET